MELALSSCCCSSSSSSSVLGIKYRSIPPKNVNRYHYRFKHSPAAPGNGFTAAGRAFSPATRVVSSSHVSGERGSGFGFRDSKIYRRQDSCLVIAPPKGVKPRAIIEFLGGAFIGAVPEVTYGYLMGRLAEEGFVVVSVPYNVTFEHSQAAAQVYERFNACFRSIVSSGLPHANLTSTQLLDLPIFSVGHR
jgi:acetyl esterase/lipase